MLKDDNMMENGVDFVLSPPSLLCGTPVTVNAWAALSVFVGSVSQLNVRNESVLRRIFLWLFFIMRAVSPLRSGRPLQRGFEQGKMTMMMTRGKNDEDILHFTMFSKICF